ncbi:MAG: ABC transporter permease subunit, partial [Ilumatobacteraceae bacterium]
MSIVVAAIAGVQIATSWVAPVIGSGLAAAATPALGPGLAAAATPALGPGFAAAATPALGPGLAAAATPVLAQSERALFEWTWVVDNREAILEATVEHLFLTASAVVAGLALSLVLCVFALRNRRLLEPILAVGNLLYTLPSLAAFALLAPFTGLTSTTAIIALTSYTVLILVRNIVTGIDGVPADVVEAAAGMGYRPARILLEIELPLALPVIIAGVRIAAVTVIGLVTV